MLRPATSLILAVSLLCCAAAATPMRTITLRTIPGRDFGREGYSLVAAGDSVLIQARDSIGLARGVQTFRQLLPHQIESASLVQGVAWTIPEVTITDSSLFAWRSAMLDPARQFLTKEFVLSYIDKLALLKMNRLHLHLTDNEGFRLQIDAFPQLTETGAWGYYDDVIKGGFYTKADIREILRYAALHGIEVIPEIDMPAHSMAMMASLPQQLMCLGTSPLPVLDKDNQSDHPAFSTYGLCVGHDTTFGTLQAILDEVFALFPSPYVHLGTDELNTGHADCTWAKCSRCQSRMQSLGLVSLHDLFTWFCDTMVTYCESKGKRVITWGGGSSTSVVKQVWGHAIEDARWPAEEGHDIIQSPQPWTYFDRGPFPGSGISLTSEMAYSLDLIPAGTSAAAAGRFLGIGAQLWERGLLNGSAWYVEHGDGTYTERAPQTNGDVVEWWSFPRMAATAEVGWTPRSQRVYGEFAGRLGRFCDRLVAMDAFYYDGDTTVVANRSLRAAVVPRPLNQTIGDGNLELGHATTIVAETEALSLATWLAGFLTKATGYTVPINATTTRGACPLRATTYRNAVSGLYDFLGREVTIHQRDLRSGCYLRLAAHRNPGRGARVAEVLVHQRKYGAGL